MLRDQKCYLRESKLSYTEAQDMALATEAADKDSQNIQGSTDASGQITPVSNRKEETIARVHCNTTMTYRPRAAGRRSPKSQRQQTTASDHRLNCYRCGEKHNASSCRYKDYECHYCHKKGHLASVYRKKAADSNPTEQAHRVEAELSSEEYPMYTVNTPTNKPLSVEVNLNGVDTKMEVDTGASVSIIAEDEFQKLRADGATFHPTNAKLFTYTGESMGPRKCKLSTMAKLSHYLLSSPVVEDRSLQYVLETYKEVFEEGLGTVLGVSASIQVDKDATPQFYRPRPLPCTLRKKVEKLERLQELNVLERVQFSDWAAPIVPVPKSDGSDRICGDYKVTINRAAKVDQYPIPRIDNLFLSLAGGKKFTKLGLSHAYLQVQLDEASRDYMTINTHKGLFRYRRLPFGVSSAPAIL